MIDLIKQTHLKYENVEKPVRRKGKLEILNEFQKKTYKAWNRLYNADVLYWDFFVSKHIVLSAISIVNFI